MNVLLLEPYFGGSHRAWAEGYAAHSRHAVALLTLPARFWKWRMHGGAVTLAERAAALEVRPDAILASDMVNLPAFLGLTRRVLADVPVALYCHENQLTYPLPSGEKRDLTYAMINWLSMVAADRVFFNSEYHREDWFGALPRMLRHFPDVTHTHRMPSVQEKSSVMPPGCDLRRFDPIRRQSTREGESTPVILWNQRWEYDKAPRTFFRALYRLAEDGVAYRIILAGKCHRQSAPEFELARERLGARVIHYGYARPEEYAVLLRTADVVVSTAIHEFFGVAVVEAVYCGCFPLLPRRLAYPEVIPAAYHSQCLYQGTEDLHVKLRWALENESACRAVASALRPAVARYDWDVMAPRYDDELADLVGRV